MPICSALLAQANARLTAENVRGDLSPGDAAAIIQADALARIADFFARLEDAPVPSVPFDFAAILDESGVTDEDVDAALSEEKIELVEPESESGAPSPAPVASESVSLGVDDEAPEDEAPKPDDTSDPEDAPTTDDPDAEEIIVPAPSRVRKARTEP